LTLDLLVLLVLAVAAVSGAASGALRQCVGLGAAVLGWLAARHLGVPVAEGLSRWMPGPLARAVAPVLLFAGIFALGTLLGALALRATGISAVVRGPADRGLGALLGGVKGALVAWVLLSALVLAAGGAPRVFGVDLRGSDFAAMSARHDLLRRLDPERARALQRVLRAARAAERAGRATQDPETRRLMHDPRVRALAERDGEIDPSEAARLLEDPEIRVLLERLARAQGGAPAPSAAR
jgi:membrane protein required for colicin V production